MSPPEISFLSSLLTAITLSNVTLPPTLPSRRSTSTVSPGATRYCFPPLRITAYMLPPEAIGKPQLYGAFVIASTKSGAFFNVSAPVGLGEASLRHYPRNRRRGGWGGLLTGSNADLHGRVLWEDDIAAARQEMNVDRLARADSSHGHSKRLRANGCSEHHSHQFEAPRAAFHAIQAIVSGRSSREANRDGYLKITNLRRLGFGAAFRIQLQILTFARLHAFEARLNFLFESVRRDKLVKNHSKLAIAAHVARRLHLHHGAFHTASLRKDEVVSIKQRLREDRVHFFALGGGCRTKRRHKPRANRASRRWRAADGLGHLRSQRLCAEFEGTLQFGEIHCSSLDILRMDGQLGNCIALDAVNFAWRFHLSHCVVPFALGFRFGFFGFLGRDILDRFLLILVGGGDEFDHLARAGSDHGLNRDWRSIGSQNRVELDFYFSCGSEI